MITKEKERVKADDCRCFKCDEILQALFHRRVAKTFIDKAEWSEKLDKTVVRVGAKLYRHKRNCKKKEGEKCHYAD